MRRFLIVGLILALLLRIIAISPVIASSAPEILWDTWGVPHIFAPSEEQLFKAWGWAQAQSHGDLILRLYGQARGKAAEYWGLSYLDSDQFVQTMDIPRQAQNAYNQQKPSLRRNWDAFAAGINQYAQIHPEAIAPALKSVLPVTGIDIFAHFQRVVYFQFVTHPQQLADLSVGNPAIGSNAWAIAPQKSATGKAMLLANPQLPWSEDYRWYEAQLTAPGVNAYGAALVGMPVFAIAFNDDLGWSSSFNPVNGATIYELALQDKGYRWDGKVEPFIDEPYRLKIRQSNGNFSEVELIRQRSSAGIIIQHQKDKAYALQVLGADRALGLEQLWDMVKSRDLSSFEQVLSRLQVPLFNLLYCDRKGNILYLYNNLIANRNQDISSDWRKIIPITNSSLLSTDYSPYSKLPRLINPPTHWLQSSSDIPWFSTFPRALKSGDYPTFIAPSDLSVSRNFLQSQRLIKLLEKASKISFETLINDKFSARLEMADRILDILIPTARYLANPIGIEAANTLAKWDRQANPNSRGAVLFVLWALTLDPDRIFSKPWSAEDPLNTPTGIKDINQALAVLEGVASQIKLLYGSLDITWGEVVRLREGDRNFPAKGAPSRLGSLQGLEIATTADERWQAVGGDSFLFAIAFNNPLQAQALMVYGNASQAKSPHRGDQLELYSQGKMRPVWRDRKTIEAHLEAREQIK